LLRARRRPGGCGHGEASPRPGQRHRHPALAVIAPLAHPPAAEIPPPLPARAQAAGGTGHPRAGPPGLPRRALAVLPQQARAGAGGRCAPTPATSPGYLARAAPGEHIAFAVGARRSARKGRLPDGVAGDDWRQATGIDAAQAPAADHRPGWRPADTSLLIRRAGRPC